MTGIRQRHGRGCKQQGRCNCPYEASVYSKRDGKKIRKAFPTRAAAVAFEQDPVNFFYRGDVPVRCTRLRCGSWHLSQWGWRDAIEARAMQN